MKLLDRRALLRAARNLLGVLPLAPSAWAQPIDMPAPAMDGDDWLLDVVVAGRRYHDLKAGRSLASDAPVTLVREPSNPHDPNAIELFAEGLKLGYVPRRVALRLAPVMDAGADVRAFAVSRVSSDGATRADQLKSAVFTTAGPGDPVVRIRLA